MLYSLKYFVSFANILARAEEAQPKLTNQLYVPHYSNSDGPDSLNAATFVSVVSIAFHYGIKWFT